jgi:hypothetical protein
MRLIKCLVVFGLSLLMGACPSFGKGDPDMNKGVLDIDIGDYENQLAAWNSQNMTDYQVRQWGPGNPPPPDALITVRNCIPEESEGEYFTVPFYYSYIKRLEKIITDKHESGSPTSYRLKVSYNTEYHYPNYIKWSGEFTSMTIILMPLEEGDLEIDTGDYENQFDAWNSQNMLDYKLSVTYYDGDYTYESLRHTGVFNVKNGISEPKSVVKFKGTVPEIYSFIKEEEERIRKEYNGINRCYFNVQYDTEYHYPVQISSGVDHHFGSYEHWTITLTPSGNGEE